MGFHVGIIPWSSLDAHVLPLVRRFATGRATRGGAPLDDVWWREAEQRTDTHSAFAFSGQYESPVAYALESLLDRELMLSEWKQHHRALQVLHLAPFLFRNDDDGRWVQLSAPSGLAVLLGNPVSLMDYWPGAYLDAEGQALKARAVAALAAVRNNEWPADPDARAVQAGLAVTYAMHDLLHEAWARCLPVRVHW